MPAVRCRRRDHVGDAPRQRRRHVLLTLGSGGFRRLSGVRLAAQFGDGVFQASLAGAVLFNPEQQATAADIAAGFATLLLPYSLVALFTGVLLDRWWRARVLVWANVLRAVAVLGVGAEIAAGLHGQPFYASALVVLSLSRFLLSALSAALPHVVETDALVTANSFSTTAGSVATTVGGAAAIGVRVIAGGTDHSYAAIAMAAAIPYLASAMLAAGFAHSALGPDDLERSQRETVAEVVRGMLAGAHHLAQRRPALVGLITITAHRICYGLWAVSTILLYRNYYRADGPIRVGLSGLAQFIVVLAAGGGLAALVTAPLTRRIGFVAWTAVLLAASGVAEVASVLPYRPLAALAGALVLGFTAQGIKVCVDTTVQRSVDDEYRGRIFAGYDTLFNVALVVAAVVTALMLPDDGHSPASVLVLGFAYLAIAAGYASTGRGGRLTALPDAVPTTT